MLARHRRPGCPIRRDRGISSHKRYIVRRCASPRRAPYLGHTAVGVAHSAEREHLEINHSSMCISSECAPLQRIALQSIHRWICKIRVVGHRWLCSVVEIHRHRSELCSALGSHHRVGLSRHCFAIIDIEVDCVEPSLQRALRVDLKSATAKGGHRGHSRF